MRVVNVEEVTSVTLQLLAKHRTWNDSGSIQPPRSGLMQCQRGSALVARLVKRVESWLAAVTEVRLHLCEPQRQVAVEPCRGADSPAR